MLGHDEILTELIRQIDDGSVKQASVAAALCIAPARVAEMRKGQRRIQPHEMPKLAQLLKMESAKPDSRPVPATTAIPILGKVAAGVWMDQSQIVEHEADTVPYDRMPGDPGDEDLFAVIPEGQSMDLIFPQGMILICRKIPFGWMSFDIGDLVVVARQKHDLRELTCKRLQMDVEGNFILVSQSSRPEFAEPIIIGKPSEDSHLDEDVTVIGKVVRGVMNFDRSIS